MRLVVRGRAWSCRRGEKGLWHDWVAGEGHTGEEKDGMWHDKIAEKSHAGEGKEVCGMTRVPRKVMPEREKRYVA